MPLTPYYHGMREFVTFVTLSHQNYGDLGTLISTLFENINTILKKLNNLLHS